MSYGMIFAIAVVLLLGWLHSSRKEAARQDVDRRHRPGGAGRCTAAGAVYTQWQDHLFWGLRASSAPV